jgi:GntR family transcriptional regulator, carbon starvation induced regulator
MPSAPTSATVDAKAAVSGEGLPSAQTPYQYIRDDIICGALRPGEKLKIHDLRLRYSAGSSPLREALSKLTADGFVTRTENRGFRVSQADVSACADLVQARCWIETIALRESIAKGSSSWEYGVLIASYDLDKCVHSLRARPYHPDQEFERFHKRYHMALISGCNSKVVQGICSQLYDHATRYRLLSDMRMSSNPRNTRAAEHRDIATAVLGRDADKAVELLCAHYRLTAAMLEKGLTE